MMLHTKYQGFRTCGFRYEDLKVFNLIIYSSSFDLVTHLPKARMLNIWLNIKNNCSMKKIKNQGMSFNSLWIPAFVV